MELLFLVYMWVIFIIFQGVPCANLHIADSLYHWCGVNAPCIVCLFVCLYAIGKNGQNQNRLIFFHCCCLAVLESLNSCCCCCFVVLFAAIFTYGSSCNLITRTELHFLLYHRLVFKSRMFG